MQNKRVAITGINGFVGHHLAKELRDSGSIVIGVGYDKELSNDLMGIVEEYHSADLVKGWPKIKDLDGVIHLAGLSAVGPSFDDPQQYINANSAMVTNICEYFMKQTKKPRILVVSSGAIYSSTQPMPITEDSRIGFSSPYAVSKVLVENQCAYYRERSLDCIVVRPFNHIGPGQGLGFLIPDLAGQLATSKQSNGVMRVGNLTTKRDYTDVRDIARAYRLLLASGDLSSTTYNVCSGKSVSGEEILAMLQGLMGTKTKTEIDEGRFRPTDARDIYGDASRLTKDTGWKPEIALKKTLGDFLKAS